LVKALFRALTGKSLNPGKKEEDVSWGAEDGQLELSFSLNGVEAAIKRDLSTERCTMTIGTDTCRKSKEIEAKLYPFLGVSPRILADIVFVMQGQIEGMLFKPPAERLKSFQNLFGTQNAERIRDLLHDELTNLSVESRKEQIEQFKTRIEKEIDPPLKEALATIETWNQFQLSKERRGEIEKLLDRQRRATFSRDKYDKAKPSLEKAFKDVADTEALIKTLEGKLERSGKELAELQPEVEKARQLLLASQAYEDVCKRRAKIEEEARKCAETLGEKVPTCEFTSDMLDQAKVDLTRAEMEYSNYEKIIAAGKASETVNHCPTCGQEISEAHVVEAKLKADRMAGPLRDLQELIKNLTEVLTAHQVELARQHFAKETAAIRLTQLQADLKELPAVTAPGSDALKEASDIVSVFETCLKHVDDVNTKLRVARDTLKVHQSVLKEKTLEVEVLKADIDKDPGAVDLAGAQEALEKDIKAREHVARASGTRDSLQKQKESAESQIKAWEAEEVKLARLRAWKECVENARRLLHRDALPGEVARSYMDAMNSRLAYYLGLFNSPFTAEISSDGTVTCRFADRPDVPSERLSGGQKVILGVAFRFAIYDLFVADLGVMILDEPTVYLDHDNVSAVAELLNHLKGYSRAAGIQLIVVTHEQQLASCFDQVIQVNS
jgi:exonuclease SbcC